MRSILLALSVTILLAGTGAGASSDAKPQRVVLTVIGMHCESCASGITAMLKRTEGILAGTASYETREAIVEYDAEKTSPEKIIAVIEKLGYKATIKK